MAAEEFKCIAKELILGTLDHPAVFKGMIDHWPSRKWTLEEWALKFNDKQVQFRIGPINQAQHSGPLWEMDCNYIQCTITEFNHWQEGKLGNSTKSGSHGTFSDTNNTKLADIDCERYWAYADYKHMAKLFEIEHDIHQCLDWSVFGFEGRKGQDSTIWIGSPHAHTPCHYDTYGCNLVAQLVGRKQWVLFPPSDTDKLYPTRIPYEESSVYSRVNISQPNTTKFPKFKFVTPYVITLEEGDVLFVPPKWWHFVKSLTTTVSINSWIEKEADNDCRFEEAVTRAVVSSYMSMYADDGLKWINPTEECTPPELNILYVRETLKKCVFHHCQAEELLLSKISKTNDTPLNVSHEVVPPAKISHFLTPTNEEREADEMMSQATHTNAKRVSESVSSTSFKCMKKCRKIESELAHKQVLSHFHDTITLLESASYEEYIQSVTSGELSVKTAKTDRAPPLVTELNDHDLKINLINALVDPEVVSLICRKLTNAYI